MAESTPENGAIRARLETMAAASNEAELRWLLGEWLTEIAHTQEWPCGGQIKCPACCARAGDRPEIEAIVAGIAQASAPCFYPEGEDGQAFEWGDGTPHWTTASEAHRMMFAIRRDDRGLEIRLRRAGAPCWHLACDECGYRYDEDEWCCHFDSAAEAKANAEDCDWHVVAGRLLCPECAIEHGEPINPPGSGSTDA